MPTLISSQGNLYACKECLYIEQGPGLCCNDVLKNYIRVLKRRHRHHCPYFFRRAIIFLSCYSTEINIVVCNISISNELRTYWFIRITSEYTKTMVIVLISRVLSVMELLNVNTSVEFNKRVKCKLSYKRNFWIYLNFGDHFETWWVLSTMDLSCEVSWLIWPWLIYVPTFEIIAKYCQWVAVQSAIVLVIFYLCCKSYPFPQFVVILRWLTRWPRT